MLFPFNEEWLKFVLYNKLKEVGIKAFLKPKIPIRRAKLAHYDYGEKLLRLIPDILIGEPYLQIWEMKNFWKSSTPELLKQSYKYEQIFRIKCFALFV